MTHPLQLAGWLLTGLSICGIAHAELRGRQVGEVLDELRSEGLTFIYNTQIVPPDLRIQAEPRAHSGIELAREILEGHGLALAQAAPRVYAVIAGSAAAERPSAAHAQPPAPQTMEEVVVQTSRYALASANLAVQTFLTQDQVNNTPRLADETLRALQRLPGSATNGFSSLGPVRGGVPNETAIILDGLRLYEPFHLKNFLSPVSLLDSRSIEGIEFYSGGFPAIYGDRMSAIVAATTVRPEPPHYMELGLNLFHASALVSSQFAGGRGDVVLSARRSNIGDLAHLSEKNFGEPHYWDAFGRADYELSDSTRASFDLLASSDSIDARRGSRAEQTRAHYRNVYAWATLDHDWSEHASSRLIGSFTDLSNDRQGAVNEPGERVGRVSDERLFHIVGLRLENELDTPLVDHRFGLEVRRLWGQYDYSSQLRVERGFPFPGSPGSATTHTASPEPDGFESSAYWDGRADLGERWTIQGGLRVDTQTYDGSDDDEQWSPRLSVLYRLTPRTRVRASWGRYFQSQGINELQVEDGIDRFHPAQHADHAILSLEHSFDAGLDLRVEAYRKYYRELNPRFENLFDPLVLFPEAEFDRVMIDPQSARAEGIELMLNVRPHGAWSGWLSYAWSRVEDRIAQADVPRNWDQRHAVNLGVMWATGPWTATLTNSFHSGWPTTMLELAEDAAAETQIVLGQRNRSQFNSYNTLDLRITRTFVLPRGALDVFVEASNALSRENACCVSYEVTRNTDGSLNIARDVDSWLPLVPSAGVLWRF